MMSLLTSLRGCHSSMDTGWMNGHRALQVILNTLLEERGELSLEYVRCALSGSPPVVLCEETALEMQSSVAYTLATVRAEVRRAIQSKSPKSQRARDEILKERKEPKRAVNIKHPRNT